VVVMMKKSVLHLVADDRNGVFANKEEAQFEMLFSLISDYHVDEEITTADQHGNHVRYLLLFLLIIIIDNHHRYNHDSYLSLIIIIIIYYAMPSFDLSSSSILIIIFII
jgi:hypothetical protein